MLSVELEQLDKIRLQSIDIQDSILENALHEEEEYEQVATVYTRFEAIGGHIAKIGICSVKYEGCSESKHTYTTITNQLRLGGFAAQLSAIGYERHPEGRLRWNDIKAKWFSGDDGSTPLLAVRVHWSDCLSDTPDPKALARIRLLEEAVSLVAV